MSRLTYTAPLLLLAASIVWTGSAIAQPFAPEARNSPTFTATLSNNVPLAFGMDAEEVSRALGEPLKYIRGRRGEEIYLAFRDIGGSGLFPPHDRLYLQFRKGRLV